MWHAAKIEIGLGLKRSVSWTCVTGTDETEFFNWFLPKGVKLCRVAHRSPATARRHSVRLNKEAS